MNTLPDSSPRSLAVVENEGLVLNCSLPDSLPRPPDVSWNINDISSSRLTIVPSTGQLVFSFVDGDTDNGRSFTCTVSNPRTGDAQQSSRYVLNQQSSESPLDFM